MFRFILERIRKGLSYPRFWDAMPLCAGISITFFCLFLIAPVFEEGARSDVPAVLIEAKSDCQLPTHAKLFLGNGDIIYLWLGLGNAQENELERKEWRVGKFCDYASLVVDTKNIDSVKIASTSIGVDISPFEIFPKANSSIKEVMTLDPKDYMRHTPNRSGMLFDNIGNTNKVEVINSEIIDLNINGKEGSYDRFYVEVIGRVYENVTAPTYVGNDELYKYGFLGSRFDIPKNIKINGTSIYGVTLELKCSNCIDRLFRTTRLFVGMKRPTGNESYPFYLEAAGNERRGLLEQKPLIQFPYFTTAPEAWTIPQRKVESPMSARSSGEKRQEQYYSDSTKNELYVSDMYEWMSMSWIENKNSINLFAVLFMGVGITLIIESFLLIVYRKSEALRRRRESDAAAEIGQV